MIAHQIDFKRHGFPELISKGLSFILKCAKNHGQSCFGLIGLPVGIFKETAKRIFKSNICKIEVTATQ